jgi:hypothetical protein
MKHKYVYLYTLFTAAHDRFSYNFQLQYTLAKCLASFFYVFRPIAVTDLPELALSHRLASPVSSCLNLRIQRLCLHQGIHPRTLYAYGHKFDRMNVSAFNNGTLFEPHFLTAFHFDWHWTGVTDSYGFKVTYGGWEIPRDCVEPVLSSSHFSSKRYDKTRQNFSARPYTWCFSKCLSVLYAYCVSVIKFRTSPLTPHCVGEGDCMRATYCVRVGTHLLRYHVS